MLRCVNKTTVMFIFLFQIASGAFLLSGCGGNSQPVSNPAPAEESEENKDDKENPSEKEKRYSDEKKKLEKLEEEKKEKLRKIEEEKKENLRKLEEEAQKKRKAFEEEEKRIQLEYEKAKLKEKERHEKAQNDLKEKQKEQEDFLRKRQEEYLKKEQEVFALNIKNQVDLNNPNFLRDTKKNYVNKLIEIRKKQNESREQYFIKADQEEIEFSPFVASLTASSLVDVIQKAGWNRLDQLRRMPLTDLKTLVIKTEDKYKRKLIQDFESLQEEKIGYYSLYDKFDKASSQLILFNTYPVSFSLSLVYRTVPVEMRPKVNLDSLLQAE